MQVFDQIRQLLVDPSQVQEREELVQAADYAKTAATIGMVASGALGLVSLVFVAANPIAGSLGLILGVGSLLVSRDVFVMSDNAKNMFGNIFTRAYHAMSAQKFVDPLLENTCIVGPLLGGKILQELQKDLEEFPSTI